MSETSPAWAPALGRLPSGLFIVTAHQGDQSTGMLASWVQQCSFDPPLVTVAVQQSRYILEWVTRAPFVVNILDDEQKKMLSHFGKGFAPDEAAFEGLETGKSEHGNVTLSAALAWIECEPHQTVDLGEHHLVVGKVIGGALQGEGKPMIHIRKNGLSY